MKIRPFLAAASLSMTVCAVPALASDWTPDDATIAKLEAKITIPDMPKHDPVTAANYVRYYSGVKIDGVFAIHGQLAIPKVGEQPAIHVVHKSDIPEMTGAGCERVSLIYDVKYDSVVWIQCSGSQ